MVVSISLRSYEKAVGAGRSRSVDASDEFDQFFQIFARGFLAGERADTTPVKEGKRIDRQKFQLPQQFGPKRTGRLATRAKFLCPVRAIQSVQAHQRGEWVSGPACI